MKKLCLALIGRDVSKSHSGRIHRFILQSKGADCVYENVSVGAEDFRRAALRLLSETDGFNITIPYKREIMPYLNAVKGDAALFGAVNTVVTATKSGYNTDGSGFMQMLEGAGIEAAGKTAVVLGAGGAGRSCAAALKKGGARVLVYQRRQELLARVCEELGVEALSDPENQSCDMLVNCTGLGMHESEGLSPVGKKAIENCRAAVDLIYRPRESEFLRLARECGKRTLNGEAMLFYQAYYSDCLYLGEKAEREEAERLWREYRKTQIKE